MYRSDPLTTEEFIQRAKSKFGEKYNYNKVKYYGMRTRIIIT